MLNQQMISAALRQLYWPPSNSHKGQNGKLLIIGGSRLFHAASKWSLDVASKIVDMVFYSSVPSNNLLIKRRLAQQQLTEEAKENFWQGIVVEHGDLDPYLTEADAVLIGPGMDRSRFTADFSNRLLKKYPQRKWVIDAGALQMLDPALLNKNCIITPHRQEMELLQAKDSRYHASNYRGEAFCLLKGPQDQIFAPHSGKGILISGGNAGLTKGGSGDVLAGLLAALYCKNDALTSCLVASYINKKAGQSLFRRQGVYYNSSDLVQAVALTLFQAKRPYLSKTQKLSKN